MDKLALLTAFDLDPRRRPFDLEDTDIAGCAGAGVAVATWRGTARIRFAERGLVAAWLAWQRTQQLVTETSVSAHCVHS